MLTGSHGHSPEGRHNGVLGGYRGVLGVHHGVLGAQCPAVLQLPVNQNLPAGLAWQRPQLAALAVPSAGFHTFSLAQPMQTHKLQSWRLG